MVNLYLISFVIYLLSTLTRVFNLSVKQDAEVMMELDGSNSLSTIVGIFIIIISFIIIFKKRKFFVRNIKPIYPVLFLYLIALTSVIWSNNPFITLKRFLKIFVYLSFFISIFNMSEPLKNTKKILLMFSSLAGITSLILILFFKKYGWMNYNEYYLPCGVFLHKNGLAIFSTLTALLLFMVQETQDKSKKTFFEKSLYVILLLETLISGATDVIGGIILGIFLGFIFLKIKNFKKLTCLTLLLLFLCFTLYWSIKDLNLIKLFNDILLSIGKDPTLTGRTDIWPILLQIGIKTHPILGSGLGSFFIGIDNAGYSRTLPWIMSHAHNTYLQSYLELGIVGFLFSIYIVIFLLKKITKTSYKQSFSYTLIVFFILYNVQSIFEVILFRPTPIFAFLPLVFYLMEYNKIHEKHINI